MAAGLNSPGSTSPLRKAGEIFAVLALGLTLGFAAFPAVGWVSNALNPQCLQAELPGVSTVTAGVGYSMATAELEADGWICKVPAR